MFTHQRTDRSGTYTRLEQIASDGRRILSDLLEGPPILEGMLLGLDQMDELIDCMMLATAEYSLAKLRIKNAQRFVQANEMGAARFEIRHLGAGLKRQLRPAATRPLLARPTVIAQSPERRSETIDSNYVVL